jgi:hypothetical protein
MVSLRIEAIDRQIRECQPELLFFSSEARPLRETGSERVTYAVGNMIVSSGLFLLAA